MSKSTEWGLPAWFLKSYKILVIEVFLLIAVGGSVRLMNAGLACPDWPLCFGDYIPDYHPQVYFEFIHRVMAGTVTIGVLVLNYFLFRSSVPRSMKRVGAISWVLITAQVIFGGLTVTMRLAPLVVATHLMLAATFFISLLWIYLGLRDRPAVVQSGPRWLLTESRVLTACVWGQIFLGGLVAANQASLVCTDFPLCHGEWFPTFHGSIGLQIIHRLGGYTLFTIILANWLIVRKVSANPRVRRLANLLFAGVCLQVGLGISNLMLFTPPLIAVAHLATGVGLLSIALRQWHMVDSASG
jgi:heme a synthase